MRPDGRRPADTIPRMQTPSRRPSSAVRAAAAVAGVLLCVPLAAPRPALAQAKPKPSDATRDLSQTDAGRAGFHDAHRRLGKAMPTGKGVIVGHVEGDPRRYTPNTALDRYEHITFVTRSGDSVPFGHAEAVARKLYGTGGLAPGIREVHNFASADWMRAGFLNAGTPDPPRLDDRPRLYTHSWIANPEAPAAAEVLRRVDYAIDEADILMCVGVNNSRRSRVPALLGSAYNVIAVGAIDGNSSGGYTQAEGPGRCKPDVVAPGGLTSYATPVAAAVVARLIEAADAMAPPQPEGDAGRESAAADNPAARSEVIKAVLMAGTTKPPAWSPAEGKPLDQHLGAGVVNLDLALRALAHPHHDGSAVRTRGGWRFGAIPAEGIITLELDVRDRLGPASVALVWNRRIDGRSVLAVPPGAEEPVQAWVHTPRLADLDLRLLAVRDNGTLTTLATSASRVDNVEYLHLPVLEPGDYRIEVVRQPDDAPDPAWDFALAWHLGEVVQDQ